MSRLLSVIGLLAFAAALLAQVPPDPAENGRPSPAAAEAGTATEGEAGAEDDPVAEAAGEGESETELTAEPAEIFVPTEEVDEDYSIPFPTDI